MTALVQICTDVESRCKTTLGSHPDWPCRKGCDDCCRSLAAVPRLSSGEWQRVRKAIAGLPESTRDEVSKRIAAMPDQQRPLVCPMLDEQSHTCLVYDARPVACRTYGFYAERDGVLGCSRIEAVARERADVIWGNHQAVMERLQPARDLHLWLESLVDGLVDGDVATGAR